MCADVQGPLQLREERQSCAPSRHARPELFGYAGDMPRRARSVSAAGDVIYHVMNRGNCRMDVFQKPGDFAAFVTILERVGSASKCASLRIA
jgi:hypothetical protein